MSTDEILVFIRPTEKRKRDEEESSNTDITLPFLPYYRREEAIRDFLGQSLSYDLISANLSIQKYINLISMGDTHQLFIQADGLYEQWKDGYEKVTTLVGIPLMVVSGPDHAFCLTSVGLYGRGSNIVGQLGLGDNEIDIIPEWILIETDGEVLTIATSNTHTLLLTTNGLFGCGSDAQGELGFGLKRTYHEFTRMINIDGNIRNIYCQPYMTFILTTTGLYACGLNRLGVLSVNKAQNTFVRTLLPVIIPEGKILSLSLGEEHAILLMSTGLYGSGNNDHGQLGVSGWGNKKRFTKIPELPGIVISVYCYSNYTIIKTSDGTLYGAGRNLDAQLALDDKEDRKGYIHHPCENEFQKMIGVEGDVISVTGNDESVIILTTTGVYQSGLNLYLPSDYPDKTRFYLFTRLDIEMGYSLSSLIITATEEDESERKVRKLHCEYCHGNARLLSRQMIAYCSKFCMLRHTIKK